MVPLEHTHITGPLGISTHRSPNSEVFMSTKFNNCIKYISEVQWYSDFNCGHSVTILKEKILLIFHSKILFKGLITLCFYIFEKLKWFRSRYLCITAPEHSSYWFTSWISQLWFKHLFPKEHLSHLLNQVEVQKAPMDYECISIVWCWSQSAAAEKNCFNPSIQGRII